MRSSPASRLLAAAGLVVIAACGGADQPAEQTDTVAFPPAGTPAPAGGGGDRIPAESGGDLVVQPIHHATFVMSWNGNTVYVDPAGIPGAGEGSAVSAFQGAPAANVVLVTDVHGDHLSVPTLIDVVGADAVIVAPQAVVDQLPEALRGRARALSNGETTSVGDVQIEAVAMYNLTEDRLQFHERGRGNGYVVTMGGTRVYIAGDTEDVPEMRGLSDIDVAFVPMNLPYTMTPQQAAAGVLAFQPRIVYPYHYGESDVDEFVTLVGQNPDIEVRVRNWYP